MKLTLVQKKPEIKNIVSFIFKSNQPFSYTAGQYLRYRFNESRFFSISSSPSEKKIMLTTKLIPNKTSDFKKNLENLKLGDMVEVTGPYGSFTIADPSQEYIFIAGGIGITPFRSIIVDLDSKKFPINITLLYKNNTEEILFKELLEEISSKNPNFKIHYLKSGQHLDEALIKSFAAVPNKFIYYISGPETMVLDLTEVLSKMGIPEENMNQDYFVGYETV